MTSILSFSTFCYILNLAFITGCAAPYLLITNTGPSVLGANVTFTANLFNYTEGKKLTFIFDDGTTVEEYQTRGLNYTISRKFSEDRYEEGTYSMNVTVITIVLFEWTVAANCSQFQLKQDLIGEIVVVRSNNSLSNAIDIEEVAVGENVTFYVQLYDPESYLKDASISYGWSVDYEHQQTISNSLVHNFTDAGTKDIKAIVTASLPNNVFVTGFFEKVVNAKVPVTNLNITGNYFMHHGETLNLKITCDGTPPFIYCYKIMRGNSTFDNFTCSHKSTFTTCHMEILKYFQEDGRYQVGVYVSNNVKEIKRVMEIMVYSVSVSPTLSTVIIPIVCSLLALIIIAGGIAYCVQHKNQMAVEVANFDFQDESNSFANERTFFENIFDSFMCRNCTTPRMSCVSESETDPLI